MFRKVLRALAWLLAIVCLLTLAGYMYFRSFALDQVPRANPATRPADLAYLRQPAVAPRGRILAVVSSRSHMADGKKKAGYELTELARAYYVFQANGFEVDIASPQGGTPPARIDEEDMGAADYAFLNDQAAQRKLAATMPLARADAASYAGIFFVGGKGAMFDFPGNADIARLVRGIAQRGVIGAVCHGPAALLDIRLDDGRSLVQGRRLTGFSNSEELFLMEKARSLLPFLLEDKAREQGAVFSAGPQFLEHTVSDGNLVTGQNPWSSWSAAEAMVAALGYPPVPRETSGEEYSVRLVASYYRHGIGAARQELARTPRFDKMLVLMHSLVAIMQGRVADAYHLQRLAKG